MRSSESRQVMTLRPSEGGLPEKGSRAHRHRWESPFPCVMLAATKTRHPVPLAFRRAIAAGERAAYHENLISGRAVLSAPGSAEFGYGRSQRLSAAELLSGV